MFNGKKDDKENHISSSSSTTFQTTLLGSNAELKEGSIIKDTKIIAIQLNNSESDAIPSNLPSSVTVFSGSVGDINNATIIGVQQNTYLSAPSPEPPVLQNEPLSEISYYVKTQHEITLQEKLAAQNTSIKRVAIYGTAGSGKTTLAKRYLQEHQTNHPTHITRVLLAETKEKWWSSLREWAEVCYPRLYERLNAESNTEKQKKMVKQVLQKTIKEHNWFILIDNWDSQTGPGFNEFKELLNIGQGIWLITTQHSTPFIEPQCSLDLSMGFKEKESIALLDKILEPLVERQLLLGSIKEKKSLTETLNHLPLALVQAGSYLLWENIDRTIGEIVFTYSIYETLLKKKTQELIDIHKNLLIDKDNIPYDAESSNTEFMQLKTQEAAIDLSLQKAIQPQAERPNLMLWHMLSFCGFLASDGIPRRLLEDYLHQLQKDENDQLFRNTLRDAQRYSLLQNEDKNSFIDNTPSLHIHRVVQRVIRDNYWPKLMKLKVNIGETMGNILQENFFHSVENNNYHIIRSYLPHINKWGSFWKIKNEDKYDNNQIEIQKTLANAYLLLGEYREAEIVYQSVLAAETDCNGNNNHKIANIKKMLAATSQALGHYKEAEKLYREAIEIINPSCLLKDSLEIALIKQGLATTLLSLGDYETSKILLQESLKTAVEYYGGKEDHLDVAKIQQSLADTFRFLGRYKEAKELYVKVLNIKINCYKNTQHIDVAKARQNLAMSLVDLDEYTTAETYYREALAIVIEYYAPKEHIHIATIKQNLANVLEQLGNHKESERLYQEAIEIYCEHYNSEDHVMVGRVKQNFGLLKYAQKDFMSALELFKTCEKIFEEKIGGSQYLPRCYQLIGRCSHLLGIQLNDKSYIKKAEEYFVKAIEVKQSMISIIEYANFLRACQNYDNAIVQLEKAFTLENPSKAGLYYCAAESDLLPQSLVEKIPLQGEMAIKHPEMLIYYLMNICLLEKKMKSSIILANIDSFVNYVNLFKHDHAEEFLPLYGWFLQNANTLVNQSAATYIQRFFKTYRSEKTMIQNNLQKRSTQNYL